jgi:hypothetical protein
MTIQPFLTPPSKSADRAAGCVAAINDVRPTFVLAHHLRY